MAAEAAGRWPHHPDFDGCFGCAPAHPAGLGVSRTVGGGFQLTVRPGHQGAPGRAHGGVLAAALDEAMGIMAWSFGRPCATARLEVDYLAPVPVNATVSIAAWCAGQDGRKVYLAAQARLGDPSGPVAARATALYIQAREATGEAGSVPASPPAPPTGPVSRHLTGAPDQASAPLP